MEARIRVASSGYQDRSYSATMRAWQCVESNSVRRLSDCRRHDTWHAPSCLRQSPALDGYPRTIPRRVAYPDHGTSRYTRSFPGICLFDSDDSGNGRCSIAPICSRSGSAKSGAESGLFRADPVGDQLNLGGAASGERAKAPNPNHGARTRAPAGSRPAPEERQMDRAIAQMRWSCLRLPLNCLNRCL